MLRRLRTLTDQALGATYRSILPTVVVKDALGAPFSLTAGGVPRFLYRTWKSRDVDILHNVQIRKLCRLNPEWSFYFFDDNSMHEFMEEYYQGTQLLKIFRNVKVPVVKADIWRLAILYIRGGCYLDFDSHILNPLDEIVGNDSEKFSMETNLLSDYLLPSPCPTGSFFDENREEFIAKGMDAQGIFLNWCFFTSAEHPLLKMALETIEENSEYFAGKTFGNAHLAVLNFAGPVLLTQAVWKYVLSGYHLSVDGADFSGKAVFKSAPRFGTYSKHGHYTKQRDSMILEALS